MIKIRARSIVSLIRSLLKIRRLRSVALCGGVGLSVLITSCMTTANRPVFNPPKVAGAEFVGSEECSFCHESVTDHFAGASHAKMNLRTEDGLDISCEACHGPGSLHAENGGEIPGQIVNPGDKPDTCFQCHMDKRAQFRLTSAHPVMDGRVTCNDCHDPHEGAAVKGGGMAMLSENQTCLECHSGQAGPFIFEHEAMRDGCSTCHDPHGSVNDKMLVSRGNNLCLQCHIEVANPTSNVDTFHRGSRLGAGSCWSAGCHEAVHGSQFSSSLRF